MKTFKRMIGFALLLSVVLLSFACIEPPEDPDLEYFTITVEKGIISPKSSEGKYAKDAKISIVALNPEENYKFAFWELDGEIVSESSVFTFNVTQDAHYIARYELINPNYYTITVQNGRVVDQSVDNKYKQDTNITIIANDPAFNFRFAFWMLDGVFQSDDATYTFKVTGDGHYIAKFEIIDPSLVPPEPGDPGFAARVDLYRFYEDFSVGDAADNTMLNSTKWGYDEGGGGFGNNEIQFYHRDNVRIVDDPERPGNRIAVITLRKEQRSNSGLGQPGTNSRNYTSGKFWSRAGTTMGGPAGGPGFASTYGKIEARIRLFKKVIDAGLNKVSTVTGGAYHMAGLWPAFWMMPKDSVYGGWPTSGEVDIMELRGRFPAQMNSTIHRKAASSGNGETWVRMNTGKTTTIGTSLVRYATSTTSGYADDYLYADTEKGLPGGPGVMNCGDWHVYCVEWDNSDGKVTFRYYVDDVLFFTINESQWSAYQGSTLLAKPKPFDQNFYVIFNLAFGGNFDGSRVPAAAASTSPPTNNTPADDTPMFAAGAPPVEYEIDWVCWRDVKPRDGKPGEVQKPVYE